MVDDDEDRVGTSDASYILSSVCDWANRLFGSGGSFCKCSTLFHLLSLFPYVGAHVGARFFPTLLAQTVEHCPPVSGTGLHICLNNGEASHLRSFFYTFSMHPMWMGRQTHSVNHHRLPNILDRRKAAAAALAVTEAATPFMGRMLPPFPLRTRNA